MIGYAPESKEDSLKLSADLLLPFTIVPTVVTQEPMYEDLEWLMTDKVLETKICMCA